MMYDSPMMTNTQEATAMRYTNLLKNPDGNVNAMYVKSMGKLFPVSGIFATDDEANAYMETHGHEGVIAEFGGHVYVAPFNPAPIRLV